MPLQDNFWLVENKHLAFAAFVVGASMYALRTGIKNDMRGLRTDIKNDIRELRMEIRTSLAAMNTSRGSVDAHVQFLHDANVGKTAPPLP